MQAYRNTPHARFAVGLARGNNGAAGLARRIGSWSRRFASGSLVDYAMWIGGGAAVVGAAGWADIHPAPFIAAGIAVFIVWNTTTLLGVALLSSVGDVVETLGLDAAIPAVFLALVWPRLADPLQRRLAIAGGIVESDPNAEVVILTGSPVRPPELVRMSHR